VPSIVIVIIIITHADDNLDCLSVFLSVCLSVRMITQKRMIPKCSNVVSGMILRYPISDMISGLKFQRSRIGQVTECKNILKAIE